MANVTKVTTAAVIQHELVTINVDTGAITKTTAATDVPFGKVTDSAPLGGRVNVETSSPDTLLIASAAINDGAFLQAGADGKVATATSTNVIVGRALEAASGDGKIFRAELFQHKIARVS